jgi:TusA-related sulfurtransferase
MEKINNIFMRMCRRRRSPEIAFDEKLDMRGYNCPKPVVHTQRKLKCMMPNHTLFVLATDPASEGDIEVLLNNTGDTLLDTQHKNGEFHYWIRKNVQC